MINGRVENHDGFQAEVPLRVVGIGVSRDLIAIVDTGFTEYLVLPPETIREFRLERRYQKDIVAGEREMSVNVYDALAVLDDETFEIEVYEADGPPLVGMALLTGFRVTVEVTAGGAVTVERLPQA